jgi:hypothetical protein
LELPPNPAAIQVAFDEEGYVTKAVVFDRDLADLEQFIGSHAVLLSIGGSVNSCQITWHEWS